LGRDAGRDFTFNEGIVPVCSLRIEAPGAETTEFEIGYFGGKAIKPSGESDGVFWIPRLLLHRIGAVVPQKSQSG
jgi:hypothetical protein